MSDETAGDVLQVFLARDWARSVAALAAQAPLSNFQCGHALMSESMVLMFGMNIEAARTVTVEFVSKVLEAAQRMHPGAAPATEARTNDNIVPINRERH